MKPNEAPRYGSTDVEKQTGESDGTMDDKWQLALAAKAAYFTRFAQQGVFYTFLGVYLVQHLHFPLLTCGFFFALIMFAQSLGTTMFTMLADASNAHTSIAVASHFVGSAMLVMLLWVQGPEVIQVAICLGLGNCLTGGAGVLVDAAVFKKVRESGLNFGQQRLWGCVGWGLTALIVSHVVSIWGIAAMWYAYAIMTPITMLAIGCLLSLVYKPQQSVKTPCETALLSGAPASPTSLGTMGSFLMHPLVAPFLTVVFVMGALFGAATSLYMSIWAIEDLHGSYYVLGVAAVVLGSSEIPCFFISADFGKRVGVHGVLYVAACAYAAWLLSYGYLIHNAWWIVAVQPLHALAFAMPIGLLGALTTKLAEEVRFPTASAQGLKQGTLNAGRTAGFLVGGWLFQAYSATFMYRVMGFSSSLMFLACGLLHIIAHSKGKCDLFY